MKRSGTSFHQFIQRIPADIKSKVRGTTLLVPVGDETIRIAVSVKAQDVRVSLRTRDPQEAKARQGRVVAYLEGAWKSHREGPRALSYREVVALSGVLYRDLTARMEEEPGNIAVWQHVARLKQEALQAGKLEAWLGATVDDLLSREGLNIDIASRERLLAETAKALADAAAHLQRNARGDYRPDPQAQRFPEWLAPKAKTEEATVVKVPAKGVSLQNLLTKLAKERGYAPKTVSEWTRSVQSLTDYAKTSDAAQITPEAIIAWMDALVEKDLSAKTINETYFAAIKAIYRWARGKRYVPINPTLDVPKIDRRDEGPGKRGFTTVEAEKVLSAALDESMPMRRWVPWLMAYSGARAGEVLQLRKEDVRQEPDTGIWLMDFAPGAGRVKNRGSRRIVPLHDHIIDQGFVDWVSSRPAGRLFYEDREGGENGSKRSRKSIAVNKLGDWIRDDLRIEAVRAGEVQPNHGWRHRFTLELTDLDVLETRRKRLMGHRLEGQDNRYVGKLDLTRLAEAVNRLPRYLAAPKPKTP